MRDTNDKLKGNHVLFTYSQKQQSPKLNQSQKKAQLLFFLAFVEVAWTQVPRLSV